MTSWTSPHGRRLPPIGKKTLIMGVVNVTPDSFSDGGVNLDPNDAVAHAGRMLEGGADILDVGGESTRPGAQPVSGDDERGRVVPVVTALRKRFPDAPISVDTYRPRIAHAALDAGADLINDVWGLKSGMDFAALAAWREHVDVGKTRASLDPSPMARVAAEWKCPVIIMHNRSKADYSDFWRDLVTDLRVSLGLARQASIESRQIWLDPGFGFGKKPRHNLEVLKRLDRLASLGFPVLLGTSRKSTIGLVLDRPVDRRLEGTATTVVWGIAQGCRMIRVHDVAEIRPYRDMADAIRMGLEY